MRGLDKETLARLLAVQDVPDALWNEALLGPIEDFLGRPGKGFRRRFGELVWRLASDAPMPAAVWEVPELLHAGSLIVDDIEDGSAERRGLPALHVRYGVPRALNAGNFLYFFALQRLGDLSLPPDQELALRRAAERTILRCHAGQALDLTAHPWTVEAKRIAGVTASIRSLKTAELFSLAAEVPARAAGLTGPRLGAVCSFARTLGDALQRLDDLGALAPGGPVSRSHEDLRLGRLTWPWALVAEEAPGALPSLVDEARRVHDGAAPGSLAARLRERCAGARARVAEDAAAALRSLGGILGPSAPLDALGAELRRLEKSYG